MKIFAWIFVVLGILSLIAAITSTITPMYEDFDAWFLDRKVKEKFMMNSIIDFAVAGYLFNRVKNRRND